MGSAGEPHRAVPGTQHQLARRHLDARGHLARHVGRVRDRARGWPDRRVTCAPRNWPHPRVAPRGSRRRPARDIGLLVPHKPRFSQREKRLAEPRRPARDNPERVPHRSALILPTSQEDQLRGRRVTSGSDMPAELRDAAPGRHPFARATPLTTSPPPRARSPARPQTADSPSAAQALPPAACLAPSACACRPRRATPAEQPSTAPAPDVPVASAGTPPCSMSSDACAPLPLACTCARTHSSAVARPSAPSRPSSVSSARTGP
jgi:hypothetical protein